MSLPAWGVWIEINGAELQQNLGGSHSPHGECGLKSQYLQYPTLLIVSLPAWGVWIEICELMKMDAESEVTPRMRSVD